MDGQSGSEGDGAAHDSKARHTMACTDAAAMKALGQGPSMKSRLLRFMLARLEGAMPSLWKYPPS